VNVILSSSYRGWILDAVIREAIPFTRKKVKIHYVASSRFREPLRFLFFKYRFARQIQVNDLVVNQKTLQFLVRTGAIPDSKVRMLRCHYTHDTEADLRSSGTLETLLKVKQILVLNKKDRRMLQELGIQGSKILVIYGAIDKAKYFPSPSLPNKKFILMTGDAKARKNPAKLKSLVEMNQDLNFVACGKNWTKYFGSKEVAPSNITIVPFSLERNSQLMRDASVYLMLSLTEGGPYPVLESLASGTPVVATPVGWVEEVVNTQNGRLVAQDASLEEISRVIREVAEMKMTTYRKDLLGGNFTWEVQASFLFDSADYD
jgi:glycosyltransferase involved in cell wall biosynthesis